MEVGSAVAVVKPGDKVLLAYPSCGICRRCRDGHPCFCTTITNKHLGGELGIFKAGDENITGGFHGQSSFANYSIVTEGAVVNANDLAKDEEELKLFAPIVCGFQTGAGSVPQVASARKENSVVVIGLGGVGLGAVLVNLL